MSNLKILTWGARGVPYYGWGRTREIQVEIVKALDVVSVNFMEKPQFAFSSSCDVM
jgi:hypothetical protein